MTSAAITDELHKKEAIQHVEQEKLRCAQAKAERQKANVEEMHRLFQQDIDEEHCISREEFIGKIAELMKAEDIRDDMLLEMSYVELKKEEAKSGQEMEKLEKNLNAFRKAVSIVDRDINTKRNSLKSLKESLPGN